MEAKQRSLNDTINCLLDFHRSLMQVQADGTNTYLYGLTRTGQEQPYSWQSLLSITTAQYAI
jgi:hypothetical protein